MQRQLPVGKSAARSAAAEAGDPLQTRQVQSSVATGQFSARRGPWEAANSCKEGGAAVNICM
jgi:hypothetical protein